jgi:hypothetical protein
MTAIVLITGFALIVALFCWCSWMYDIPVSHIPETELEKNIRELKLRIAEAEWKFNRELDKYR